MTYTGFACETLDLGTWAACCSLETAAIPPPSRTIAPKPIWTPTQNRLPASPPSRTSARARPPVSPKARAKDSARSSILHFFSPQPPDKLLRKGLDSSFRAKRGISRWRKPKRRGVPHSADSVRNDGLVLFPQAARG